jgi:outer membrane protein OmpA-like peptidoglycan-associated protein
MSTKFFRYALLALAAMVGICTQTVFAAEGSDLQIQTAKPGTTVTVERIMEDGKAVVSVVDAGENPVFGLSAADFAVAYSGKSGKILSVKPLTESQDVPRHIVLVLDNSDSMSQRHAVEPLLAGVGELLKTVRPIDDVQIVVFDTKQTMDVGGRKVHVRTFTSKNSAELQDFVTQIYHSGMTSDTVLYDAMLAGFEIVGKMPSTEPRFMVVFSDGEDLNSIYKAKDVFSAAQKVGHFNGYAIDFQEGSAKNKFLTQYATKNHGQIWKATSETNLVPIFQSVATTMQLYYIVSYAFPLTGTLAVAPDTLTIEEIKTVDSSPMLGQIYFADGSSEIPSQIVRFASPGETAGFDEQKFHGTLDKYYQLLNIVGKRLTDNPDAKITLVGCNSNTGKEKGNKKLSAKRTDAVRDYLQTFWSIAPERMSIEARDLPAMPSAGRLKEGQAENRRVEIRSTDPTILAPIQSTYIATQINAPELMLHPVVDSPYGIASWKMACTNSAGSLADLTGDGAPATDLKVPLPTKDLQALGNGGDIAVKMECQDKKGQNLTLSPAPVKVNYIQTSQRLAEKQGERVQEKYALILFDFNKDTIEAGNQEIVNRIVARIQKLPQATVQVVGHTDNIGKEDYNIKLSERRAQAVAKLIAAGYGEAAGDRIHEMGVGPNNPLYDNATPEGRAFNRTVTITLEYLSAE